MIGILLGFAVAPLKEKIGKTKPFLTGKSSL